MIMKIGDLVKYRSRHVGDPIVSNLAGQLGSTSYDDHGVIIEITEWRDFRGTIAQQRILPNEGIVFLNQDGDFVLAWMRDLRLLAPA